MASKSKHENVYDLPRAVYTGTDTPLKVSDPIYPRKAEVGVGSKFSFHGHLQDHVTIWRVEAIYTTSSSESGREVESYVAHVKLLDDVMVLRCEETRESRRRRFRHLSYSAAWRMVVEK
jgi:hypothetical protein